MAANDPRPVVNKAAQAAPTPGIPRPANGPEPSKAKAMEEPRKPALSYEDAELFASRIRPSWELVDDVMREEVAAELADPAPAPAAAPPPAAAAPAQDTIIEGVPTVAIGSGPLPVPPEAAVPLSDGAPAPSVAREAAPSPAAAAPARPGPTQPEAKKAPPPAPTRAGKTKVGMGEATKSVAKTLPDTAPASKPPSSKSPASRPGVSKPGPSAGAVAATASRPGDITDDIEIPVTGASNKTLVWVGLGLAAVVALGAIGYGVMGGSGDKKTVAQAPTATATAAAAPLPATVPPPPPADEPAGKAPAATTATATAAAATAAPTATAKATAEPKPAAEPKPEPKAAAEPKPKPEPEPKKTAAAAPAPEKPAAPKGAGPATGPKKGGGGIIRETPF